MSSFKVTIVQTDLAWEDREANLKALSQKIAQISEPTDVIVLPEMFTTGFTMNTKAVAETMDGSAAKWLQEQALATNSSIVGSIIVNENDNYFNRLIWMRPDGTYDHYDKRHLFRMGNEHLTYTAGETKLIVEDHGWQFRPLTCYDLRFPVWSRNQGDYDVLIYIANWPESRREAWKTLLAARAIENQAYVIGVNRIGTDGMGLNYSGDSMVIDPKGEIISQTEPYQESVETIELCLNELDGFREKFPVAQDADEFSIN